jgi:hypothetical protein
MQAKLIAVFEDLQLEDVSIRGERTRDAIEEQFGLTEVRS